MRIDLDTRRFGNSFAAQWQFNQAAGGEILNREMV